MTAPAASEIHGTIAPGFEPVRDAFAANFSAGLEVGASFAATVDGKPVVDIWAGSRNSAESAPWEQDTIACVFSTTKAAVALACAMLVDRGLLEYEQPVAKYWPEFAQNGKEKITVAQLLSHQAGLPGVTNRPVKDWYDWTAITEALAAEKPWWEPGTANGYHAISFGHLNGEVIRRVSGKPSGRSCGRRSRARSAPTSSVACRRKTNRGSPKWSPARCSKACRTTPSCGKCSPTLRSTCRW